MTKIVAFSGKKQAGKNTSGNFLFGLEMWSILDPATKEPLIDWFKIDEKGRLIIPVDFGPEKGGVKPGIFDPSSKAPAVQTFLANHVWPYVKMYSFADVLKSLCINLFNLPEEKVYGSDAQKNEDSELIWENMPGMPKTKKKAYQYLIDAGFTLKDDWDLANKMSIRHVLQYVGTEIFRKMYHDVWVNATIKSILADSPEIAIITDCRFPNEVLGVQNAGGHVIRLTRAPFAGQDEHLSETALDDFTPDQFDSNIDNTNMSIQEQNEAVFNELVRLNVIQPEK